MNFDLKEHPGPPPLPIEPACVILDDQVAEWLGVDRETVVLMTQHGVLPGVLIGRKVARFPRGSLDGWRPPVVERRRCVRCDDDVPVVAFRGNAAKCRACERTARKAALEESIRRYDSANRAGRRRYALLLAASGRCSTEQLAGRIAYYGWACWMCGDPWDQIDHVLPVSKGGSKWPANLRPSCGPCNRKKSAGPAPARRGLARVLP